MHGGAASGSRATRTPSESFQFASKRGSQDGPPDQAAQYGDSLRISYTDASANKDAFDQTGVTNLFQKTSNGVYKDQPELWAPAVESGSIDYMITNAAGAYNRWCATQQ